MLIVIPLCDKELELGENLVDWLAELGGLKNYNVLLSLTQKASKTSNRIADKLAKIVNRVDLFVLPVEDERGWPYSANTHFKYTADYINKSQTYNEPWYWFEADNLPFTSDWADSIAREYQFALKPCLGVINDTYEMNGKGELTINGKHMVGTGVYPKDIMARIPILAQADQIPFDVFIQYYLINPARSESWVHNSMFIHHAWHSCNYRLIDGVLHYDRTRHGKVLPTPPVPSTAKIVHGCKDGSLLNILKGVKRSNSVSTPLTGGRDVLGSPVLADKVSSPPLSKCESPRPLSPTSKYKVAKKKLKREKTQLIVTQN